MLGPRNTQGRGPRGPWAWLCSQGVRWERSCPEDTEQQGAIGLFHQPPWTSQAPCGQTVPPRLRPSHLLPLPQEHRWVICLDRMKPRIFQLTHTSIEDEVNNNTNNSRRLLSTYYKPGTVLHPFISTVPVILTTPTPQLLVGNEDAHIVGEKNKTQKGLSKLPGPCQVPVTAPGGSALSALQPASHRCESSATH